MKNLQKIKGFSLPEMIVVVACLAVIVGLSFGDVTKLFDKQTFEEEKLVMQKIEKAMQVYAEKEGKLPVNTSMCDYQASLPGNSDIWSIELAKYSNLTADNMCFDNMGNKRTYISRSFQKAFRNGAYRYDVHYASVLSNGINKFKDTPDWNVLAGPSGFTEYTANDDDHTVKFTDEDIKLKRYMQTLTRIEALEKALERYNRSKRSSARTLDIEKFDNYIMYPDDGRSGPGNYLDTSVTDVESDLAVDTLSEEISAVSLTDVLGLPEYLGKNAVTGKSLWYVSNPGPDRAHPCTGSKSVPPYYPPAIFATTNDVKPADC